MLTLFRFVPESMCLNCKGCCRYAALDTPWAPVFMIDEIRTLVDHDIVPASLFSHPGQHKNESAKIILENQNDSFFCPCLNISSGRCIIYSDRPFDCRLYPFLLVRKNKDVYLAVDKKCPYVNRLLKSVKMFLYKFYLKNFLRSKAFVKLAKINPEIAGDYGNDPDIELLSVMPILSRAIYETVSSNNKR